MSKTSLALERIALGLAAGLVGTIVMTLGQKAEMALTGRSPSKQPAEAVETITGIDVADEASEQRLSTATHYAYGTALGASLAALEDVPEPARTALYFAGAQATGMALVEALKLDGRPSQWTATSAATDVAHHVVYALAASLAYRGGKRLLALD